jgi:hypothetical protein
LEHEHYEIRTKGTLGEEWSLWFDGMSVKATTNGETIIAGPVTDQSALHGLLLKIRNLGLPLLSLQRIEPGGKDGGQLG